MFIIKDIIWLNKIAEKLAWKHNIVPLEVEEVLRDSCKIFKKETGKVEGEHLYNALIMPLEGPKQEGIYPCFL